MASPGPNARTGQSRDHGGQALLGSQASARQSLTARRSRAVDRSRERHGWSIGVRVRPHRAPCGASLPVGRSVFESGRPETGVYPLTAMCSVPFWPSRCKAISTTSCVKRAPRRNGRNCCAISTGCRMCVSSIAAQIGWCARMRRQTSPRFSVTPISSPALGKPCRRRLHHRHRPPNAAVAQSVVPRRLKFRRNSHEIRDL